MYKKHEYWVKCYLNDIFWEAMTTTGRSESMSAYFDGYVHSNTMLNEFMVQHDKIVLARLKAEEKEDFQTMNTQAP